ncbi:hypothetical protein EII17_01490 [Clostridiales bacterium COT073_COT-073]|nr:hypothetical protein EII17_01490 [Clostridiales bacterium COT073_COT-073]
MFTKTKKILSGVMAVLLLLTFFPDNINAVKVRENEEYKEGKTLRPISTTFHMDRILEWDKNNPDNELNKASVPLQERFTGHVINPLANPDARVQALPLMNSKSDEDNSVNGNEFACYAFDFWQYLDQMVFWDGPVPTPDVIDAGHRNGVPVYGTLFFNWSTSQQDQGILKKFLKKTVVDGKTIYPVADKIVEIAEFYGFDGYFINQETSMYEPWGKEMRDFMLYAQRKAQEKGGRIRFAWYDAMANDGYRNHYNAVTSGNDFFVKKYDEDGQEDENGQYASDEFFMNFNWGLYGVNGTVEHMKNCHRDPFDAYAGFELQQNSYNTSINYSALLDGAKKTKLSLGLFTPDSILGLSNSPEDYHEQERNFWVGFDGDPATSGDKNKKGKDWRGIARFVADKSVIMQLPFNTFFNTGHGRQWFIDGQISKGEEWHSRGVQDILPTWRWWIRSDHAKPLKARYDFDDAYNSGNSVKFEGEIAKDTQNTIKLFSTKLAIDQNTKVKVAYRNGLGSRVYIGLATAEDYNDDSMEWFALNNDKNFWWTSTVDVSKLAGKTAYAIALKVVAEEDKADYSFNLGQIAVYKDSSAPAAVSNFKIDDVLFRTSKDAEARLSWEPVEGAEYYEVYQQNADQTMTIINATSSRYFYAEKIFRTDDMPGTTQELYVVAVGKNGVKSDPALAILDWQMLVGDTGQMPPKDINFCLNATVTGFSHENSSEPARNAINGTITGNADKWCSAPYRKGWMSIAFAKPETVRRLTIYHAEAGGEASTYNTRDFSVQYKDEDGKWQMAYQITGNTAGITDVNLSRPITAKEWKLDITKSDVDQWPAIRIYEWQMFGNPIPTQTAHIPMRWVEINNTGDNLYQLKFKNVPKSTEVTISKDKSMNPVLLTKKATENGETIVFDDVVLEADEHGTGRIFYTTKQDGMEASIVMAKPYRKAGSRLTKIALTKVPAKRIYLYDSRLRVEDGEVTLTYEDNSQQVIALSPEMISGFNPRHPGKQVLHVKYLSFVAGETFSIKVKGQNEPKVASGVAISVEPKNSYLAGEALDLTQGVLIVSYDDLSEEQIAMVSSEVTVSGYQPQVVGVQTLVVSVFGVETQWQVTVNEPEKVNKEKLEEIIRQARLLMDKDLFQYVSQEWKEKLNQALTAAEVVFNDDEASKEQVSDAAAELSTVMIQLVENTVVKVELNKEPLKLQYQYGEALDLTGASLSLTYGNQRKEEIDITEAMVSGYDPEKPGTQEITVTYQTRVVGQFKVVVDERPLVKELREEIKMAEALKDSEDYHSATKLAREALNAVIEQAKMLADANVGEQEIRDIINEIHEAIVDLKKSAEELKPKEPLAPYQPDSSESKQEERVPAPAPAPAQPQPKETIEIKDDKIALSSAEKALVEQLSENITGEEDKQLIEKLVTNKVTNQEFVQKVSDRALVEYAQNVATVFTDESKDNWYAKELSVARMLKLVKGYDNSTFSGNNKVTGKEFMTMLVRLGALELTEADGDWFAPYKQAATKAGLLKDVTFELEKELTREEVAFLAYNFLTVVEKKVEESSHEIGFVDKAEISEQYQKAISYLAEVNVLKGYEDGNYRPQDAVKRQEVVVILYRLLKRK